tara:strand:- start:701 stop:1738 length:1038 start_codon:yes stop_codon:yes gene_type:complete
MHFRSKIPATVLTGFLGAGKTSTIRHILQNTAGLRLALIINEFGDLGVDGEIIKGCGIPECRDENVVELANGCICCTVADDFIPAMDELISRADPPDHIIIETSGLALPKPLVKAFNWPEVRSKVTVDGVVAVVDGPAVTAGLLTASEKPPEEGLSDNGRQDHENPIEELFEEQLGSADIVLINKTDLIDKHGLAKAVQIVKSAARPNAKVINTAYGRVDTKVLLGLEATAENDLETRLSHHDGMDHSHNHDEFESFSIRLGVLPSAKTLQQRIGRLVENHDILRIKGFAAIEKKPLRFVIQGVGTNLSFYYDRPWKSGEDCHTELVVIGLHGLDEVAIHTELAG